MSAKLPATAGSHEVPNCDAVRPRMAKAGLRVTPSHTTLRDVIAALVRNSPDKKEAIASEMGKDRALMYRQLGSGRLTVEDLEALGTDFAVQLAEQVLEVLGPLATPKARAKQRIRDARAILDELDQAVELIA